jgi:hypothetical protein
MKQDVNNAFVSGYTDAFVCLVMLLLLVFTFFIILKKIVFDDEIMVCGSTITRPVLNSQDNAINDYNETLLIEL